MKAILHLAFIAITVMGLLSPAAKSIETIRPDGQGVIDLAPAMEALYEPTGRASLEEVRNSTEFRRIEGERPNFGFRPGSVWGRVRLDLTALPLRRWLFVWDLTFIDTADVYVLDDDGTVLGHQRMGTLVGPPADKATFHWFDLFEFRSEPVTLYVRNDSRYALRVDSKLMNALAYGRDEARLNLTYGLLNGALGVVAVLFGGLGLLIRSRLHAYGCLLALSVAGTNLMVSALNRPLGLTLSPGDDWVMAQFPILGVKVFLVLFVAEFCGTGKHWPRLYGLMLAAGAAASLIQVWSVFAAPYQALEISTIVYYGAATLVLLMIFADPKVRRNIRAATAIAVVPFLALSVLHLIAFNNWAPNILPFEGGFQHFLDIGFVLLLVCFLVAVGYMARDQLQSIVLQRTAQLAEANRVTEVALASEQSAREHLRTFIQMATHEFKNPLATIDGAAQVLSLLVEPDNREINSRLTEIRDAVQRIVGLISLCLSGERYEKLRASFGRFNLAAKLERVILRNQGREPSQLLVRTSNMPESCVADAGLLGIALDALIDNARRYGPAVGAIEIDVRASDTSLICSVSDRGPGIHPDDARHVFKKYYRSERNAGISGTGIGLHLVQVIANLHGGSIAYAPRPGGGAVFTLTIPLDQAAT